MKLVTADGTPSSFSFDGETEFTTDEHGVIEVSEEEGNLLLSYPDFHFTHFIDPNPVIVEGPVLPDLVVEDAAPEPEAPVVPEQGDEPPLHFNIDGTVTTPPEPDADAGEGDESGTPAPPPDPAVETPAPAAADAPEVPEAPPVASP